MPEANPKGLDCHLSSSPTGNPSLHPYYSPSVYVQKPGHPELRSGRGRIQGSTSLRPVANRCQGVPHPAPNSASKQDFVHQTGVSRHCGRLQDRGCLLRNNPGLEGLHERRDRDTDSQLPPVEGLQHEMRVLLRNLPGYRATSPAPRVIWGVRPVLLWSNPLLKPVSEDQFRRRRAHLVSLAARPHHACKEKRTHNLHCHQRKPNHGKLAGESERKRLTGRL